MPLGLRFASLLHLLRIVIYDLSARLCLISKSQSKLPWIRLHEKFKSFENCLNNFNPRPPVKLVLNLNKLVLLINRVLENKLWQVIVGQFIISLCCAIWSLFILSWFFDTAPRHSVNNFYIFTKIFLSWFCCEFNRHIWL